MTDIKKDNIISMQTPPFCYQNGCDNVCIISYLIRNINTKKTSMRARLFLVIPCIIIELMVTINIPTICGFSTLVDFDFTYIFPYLPSTLFLNVLVFLVLLLLVLVRLISPSLFCLGRMGWIDKCHQGRTCLP